MTAKRFTCIDESIINIQTDELVNASSEEGAKILVDWLNELAGENKDLREQLILANAFIKMIENCYEDASIEDILYMKYGEFQEELHLQIAIAKEEL
jgi:hypothetical protein